MPEFMIATIPGDGVGREVLPESIRVLDAVAARYGASFRYTEFDWSTENARRSIDVSVGVAE